MTLSRRSFLKGLAVLPAVVALLPKEVPAAVALEPKFKKFGMESSHFDGNGIYWETYTGDIPIGTIVCFSDEYGSKVKPVSGNKLWAGPVVRKNVILIQGEFPTVFSV
jgi:hypothetical protein